MYNIIIIYVLYSLLVTSKFKCSEFSPISSWTVKRCKAALLFFAHPEAVSTEVALQVYILKTIGTKVLPVHLGSFPKHSVGTAPGFQSPPGLAVCRYIQGALGLEGNCLNQNLEDISTTP